jgi:hypothetical protein
MGKNGDSYVIGIKFWELTDSGKGEHGNWGLISHKENAYDGKEAVRAGQGSMGIHYRRRRSGLWRLSFHGSRSNFTIQELVTRDLAPYAQNAGTQKYRV